MRGDAKNARKRMATITAESNTTCIYAHTERTATKKPHMERWNRGRKTYTHVEYEHYYNAPPGERGAEDTTRPTIIQLHDPAKAKQTQENTRPENNEQELRDTLRYIKRKTFKRAEE